MNVACPECRSVFRVDPAKVPAGGVRARCSVCGAVMRVDAPTTFGEDTWGGTAAPTPRYAAVAGSGMRTPTPEQPAAAAWMPAASTPRSATPPSATPPSATPGIATPRSATPVSATPATATPVAATPVAVPPVAPPPTPPAPRPPVPPPTAPSPVSAWRAAAPAVGPSGAAAPAGGVTPGLRQPPTAATGMSAPPAERAPINPFLANDPNQKAKRLARALVSDIVAYHPQQREQGLRDGTLRQLFKDEIKKSYEEYVEQVGKEFAESTAHFQESLNDILAGGRKMF